MPVGVRRRLGLLVLVPVVWAVVLASGAWGCVLQPFISLSPVSSGPAGSSVTVVGTSFQGPVELRWNAITGPKLGTASGSTFAVPIVVPRGPAGLYTILAIGRGADGSVASAARAEFLVTVTASSVGPTTGVPGSSGGASSRPTSGSLSAGAGAAIGAGGGVLLGLGALVGSRWGRRGRPATSAVGGQGK